jgi:hypothetical protein
MPAKATPPKKTKKAPAKAEVKAPTKPLEDFIEAVNKQDKPNGLKIRFAFTKRKR